MIDYTLEEVLDFINSEIEDAYTEASKEEDDNLADVLAKEGESYRKSSYKYKSKPSKGDKRNPKGDLEAIRRKNIRKSFYNKDQDQPDNMAYNMKHFDPDTFKKFSAGTDYFDSSNYTKKSPYYNTYKDNEEDIEKLRFAKQTNAYGNKPSYLFGMMKSDDTIKDKLDKDEAMNELKLRMSAKLADKAEKGFKSKDVEERYNKWKSRYESVIENIIEAYEYDVISYEDANDYLDMLALFED